MQLFLVLYSFLYSVAQGEVRLGARTAAEGPGSQPVSHSREGEREARRLQSEKEI